MTKQRILLRGLRDIFGDASFHSGGGASFRPGGTVLPTPNLSWSPRSIRSRILLCVIVGAMVLCAACDKDRRSGASAAKEVVVYCSVDEVFAREILNRYEARSGVRTAVVPDSEAGKTTGLVNRIVSEHRAGRPRCDVFWSSELFNTILLSREGLLEPYEPPTARDIPKRFRDEHHQWTALAVRARVIAFDPHRVARADVPTRWADLAAQRTARMVAIGNPLFGTTRGHVAAMFALWGHDRGVAFLKGLHDGGALITDGNSAAVRAVIAGRARFACTDTDDVWVAQRSGASIDLVYPDMGDGGTLLVPCSVAIIQGGPNPQAARDLVDYLVSAEVERMLASSDSRNVPVREALRRELGMSWPAASRVEYDAVADAMEDAVRSVRDILLR